MPLDSFDSTLIRLVIDEREPFTNLESLLQSPPIFLSAPLPLQLPDAITSATVRVSRVEQQLIVTIRIADAPW